MNAKALAPLWGYGAGLAKEKRETVAKLKQRAIMAILGTTMAVLRIQELLDETGKNLHWLSKETGISYTTLLRYRDGEKKSIRLEHAEAICTTLKRDANALMGIGKAGKLR